MNIFDEKHAIYGQMTLLSAERRELTKAYFELKERLIRLDVMREESEKASATVKQKNDNIFSNEIEYQKYMMDKKQTAHSFSPYSIISLKLASILKEAGRPLSGKELFTIATKKHQLTTSYKNLINNILPKMNKDSSINVEHAYRGYWQYRLH